MRLDLYLNSIGKYESRSKAAQAISRGEVLIKGKAVKPSFEYNGEEISYIDSALNCVSNGGYKLYKALEDFAFDINGLVAADIGASTGGFTECLLKNGCKKVYAIDVGTGLLHPTIANDERVIVKDGINARNLTVDDLGELCDLATIDVSFISLTYVLKNAVDVLKDNGHIIALIKPQFECGNKNLGKSGIVKTSFHKEVLENIYDYCLNIGLFPVKLTYAPIKDGKNVEFPILLSKAKERIMNKTDITNLLLNIKKCK